MSSTAPCFTVFTPTYNRAGLLGATYACLCAQTFRDFEWLIVDDGSTDGTPDLVAGWQHEAQLTIRYLRRPNGGKHRAHNLAAAEARGRFFLTLDSDDTCVPAAIERLKAIWDLIPPDQQAEYSGVSVLCQDEQGLVVGDPYPAAHLDSTAIDMALRFRVRGEKWGFHRTDVLRQFLFPEFEGERFMAEGLVWNRIGRQFRMRFANEALRIYRTSANGLSSASRHHRVASPQGARLFYQERLGLPLPLRERLASGLNYLRFSFHGRIPSRHILGDSGQPLLIAGLWLPGFLIYRWDCRQLARQP